MTIPRKLPSSDSVLRDWLSPRQKLDLEFRRRRRAKHLGFRFPAVFQDGTDQVLDSGPRAVPRFLRRSRPYRSTRGLNFFYTPNFRLRRQVTFSFSAL